MVYICVDNARTVEVASPNVSYTESTIESRYNYETVSSSVVGDRVVCQPIATEYTFRTQRRVPRTGVLIVGLGGNNGSTFVAGIMANREGICWKTRDGVSTPNYYGSMTQASTTRLGTDKNGDDIFVPLSTLVPLVAPNDLVIGGWDISNANLAEAMERAKVLPYDLQRQLAGKMSKIVPMPSVFDPDFVAANQADRANNVKQGTRKELVESVREDIRRFKAENNLERVIVLWSANTERFCDCLEGLNDTAENMLRSIDNNESEVSPSTIFAVASILEGAPFINGSPQNTFVPGVIALAEQHGVPIGGDDFKTGQTKLKSVLVDFLIGAGIKPVSIVSYNHLGNNDGKNLSSEKQFRSKEVSKSNVVTDMVASNSILYKPGEHPDHTIVIKYVPYVGDSKRAMDEYTSQIFLGGHNTLAIHNTCEDSLLAVPVMIDLVILTEFLTRVEFRTPDMKAFSPLNPILSSLSYLLKAPLVPDNTPIVNSLNKQRESIENFFRALNGLPAENNMLLEQKAFSRQQMLDWIASKQAAAVPQPLSV